MDNKKRSSRSDNSERSDIIRKVTQGSVENANVLLLKDLRRIIEETRSSLAQTVNAGQTMLYWRIGKRITQDILHGERARYGDRIVSTVSRQLSWSHFKTLIHIENNYNATRGGNMAKQRNYWSPDKSIGALVIWRMAIGLGVRKLRVTKAKWRLRRIWS